MLGVERDSIRKVWHPNDKDMTPGVRTPDLRKRTGHPKRLSQVEERRRHHLIVLKNTPLNVPLLPQLPMSFNPGSLEAINQEARSLIKQVKSMAQLPSGQWIASIDRRIERRTAALGLLVLVLPTKEQKFVGVRVSQPRNMLY